MLNHYEQKKRQFVRSLSNIIFFHNFKHTIIFIVILRFKGHELVNTSAHRTNSNHEKKVFPNVNKLVDIIEIRNVDR